MRWKLLFITATIMKIFFFLLMFSGIARFEAIFQRDDSDAKTKSHDAFRLWMEEHGKFYKSEFEYKEKFSTFYENLNLIENLNKEQKSLGNDVEFGLNQFADMTLEEFRKKILMPKHKPIDLSTSRRAKNNFIGDLPKEFDWRSKGVVGSVRDQGSAGTCWAFSTVQAVEGQWALKTGGFTELSVEQIVDCDSTHDNKNHANCGVFGGWPFLAFEYIKREGGIEKESDYPYCCGLGGDKGTCFICPAKGYNKTLCGPPVDYCQKNESCEAKLDRSKFVPGLKVSGWSAISEDETKIAEALVSSGPLSIAIDASTLQFYRSGVWDPLFCDPKALDHAVLLTGFGVSHGLFSTDDYWTIKNSWGKKWGEDGYFRLIRNKGKCGMNTQVTVPLLE